jgi:tetratricopeptide (TPR) repeat protein
MEKGNLLWAHRDNKESLSECISIYESVAKADPNNEDVWLKLSHAYNYMGFYILKDKNEKKKVFEKGKAAAEHAVKINPKSAGGNYWLAMNMGCIGDINGVVSSVYMLHKLIPLLVASRESDPNYYYGGQYRFVGMMINEAPTFLLRANGKDLPGELSRKNGYKKEDQITYFLDAVNAGPNFFANRFCLARGYLQLNRAEQAKKELEWIVNTPEDILPDSVCENRYWKHEAETLLNKINNQKT